MTEGGDRPDARAALPTAPVRVVIADDSDEIRYVLARALRGFEDIIVIAEAQDGREAVELVRKLRPHAVVMDGRMPHMDGVEATQLIGEELPEVVVVGYSSDASLKDALFEAGAAHFIPKGEPLSQLAEILRRISRADEKYAHHCPRPLAKSWPE